MNTFNTLYKTDLTLARCLGLPLVAVLDGPGGDRMLGSLEHIVEAVLEWEPSVAGPFSAWLYASMSECGAPAASYRSAIFARLPSWMDQQNPM